ncbi:MULTISPECIES: hypothetical protein [Mycolicibacterium]|uniref:hypothetical protein n=1 Tax=Mycolicibacterium TaxID=1866885 RepID=UPI002611B392|nr:hypothetical protein [Mycolicibacterium fortuitum]
MTEQQGKTIKIDTDVARAVVGHLSNAADGLDPVLAKIAEFRESFRKETAQNVQTGHQAPYFTPLDASLDRGLRKIEEAIAQVKRNVYSDVQNVSSLTDGLEDVAAAAATKISGISIR